VASAADGGDGEPPRSQTGGTNPDLTRLTDAVTFEEFIRKISGEDFFLDGSGEPHTLLDLAIEKAGDQGIKEIVFGMAHRGCLNVLANIVGKSASPDFPGIR
jgi:2-oxoglutarate dehydrogenase E1 component